MSGVVGSWVGFRLIGFEFRVSVSEVKVMKPRGWEALVSRVGIRIWISIQGIEF